MRGNGKLRQIRREIKEIREKRRGWQLEPEEIKMFQKLEGKRKKKSKKK